MKKNNYLSLFYDREADVLYFSKGIPSKDDIADEAEDEVVVRKNPKTKEITGFTILNFSKKTKQAKNNIRLPLEINLRQHSLA